MRRSLNFIFLGAPGAGKGTFGKLISKRLDIPHISVGDVLRQEVRAGSALGQRAAPIMARGGLIPDELVTELVQSELKKNTRPGFILDGFPRTLKQAQVLETFSHVDFAVHISLERWAIIEKLKGRLVCKGCGQGFNSADIITPPYHMPALVQDKHACSKGYDFCAKNGICESRNDDTDEVINARLNTYDESIAPILNFYRNNRKLKNFDVYTGVGDTDALVEAMLRSDGDCSAPEHAQ